MVKGQKTTERPREEEIVYYIYPSGSRLKADPKTTKPPDSISAFWYFSPISSVGSDNVPVRLVLRRARISGPMAKGGQDSLLGARQCRQDHPSPYVEGRGL